MSSSEKHILDAAIRMFARYGVKRTTMGDLAEGAGVSRQTLYKAFKNKDDVLRALIRAYTDDALDQIEAGLKSANKLNDQLDIIFDRMTVAGYDLVAETPNAQDLIDGFNCAGKEELATSAEKFRLVIERVLLPHHAALARAGLTPKDLSDFIQRSTKAVSQTARDKAHLLRLLRSLKHLCLSACEMQRERCEPRH